jgi:hypothetical protein
MQEHFKKGKDIEYARISVVVTKEVMGPGKILTYEYLGTYNFFNQHIDNYFTLPIRNLAKGRYVFRVYAYWL